MARGATAPDSDLGPLFHQMRDPESVRMAAFTPDDPNDRTAFDAHMATVRSSPGITLRAVTCDNQLVGSIATFVLDGRTEVTYWIDRAAWGRGIASRALELLLDLVPVRPLHAHVASDNAASLGPPEIGLQGHRNRELLRARQEQQHRGNHPAEGLAPTPDGQSR